jgi:creatinine amidohydrolase
MRTVQMEYLRPEELVAERERRSIVYLPVGPLEWHGPAMPLGTDPLTAQELARHAAEITGGVVMPTVFFGTERDRPTDILATKGFPDAENMYVLGMDVPKNCYKSFYAREEIFALMIREYLRLLVQEEYKLIVIVNGHGAWGQKGSLERLAIEFSHETPSRVLALMPDTVPAGEEADFGHGTKLETSLLRYLFDENVDLKALPPRDVPLKYTDYGIADDFVFSCKRSPNDAVVYDPRDATPELGKKMFELNLQKLCKTVEETYQNMTKKNGG